MAPGSALPTPTLRELADDLFVARETVRARGIATTAEQRVELAQLTAPGGRIARAVERLDTMTARLEEVLATPPAPGRRYGEADLPDELVATRRQREHTRKVRQARKRVEDERTVVAELRTRQSELEAGIAQTEALAESRRRVVGRQPRAEATSYLTGALRKHRDRPLLSAQLSQLTPGSLCAADERSTAS